MKQGCCYMGGVALVRFLNWQLLICWGWLFIYYLECQFQFRNNSLRTFGDFPGNQPVIICPVWMHVYEGMGELSFYYGLLLYSKKYERINTFLMNSRYTCKPASNKDRNRGVKWGRGFFNKINIYLPIWDI